VFSSLWYSEKNLKQNILVAGCEFQRTYNLGGLASKEQILILKNQISSFNIWLIAYGLL